MAVQNYLAVKTQRQLLTSEIAREKWEIENKPDDERREIMEIYEAERFLQIWNITKYPDCNPKENQKR